MKLTDKEICEALLRNRDIKRSWWKDVCLSLDRGGDLVKTYADLYPRSCCLGISDLTADDWMVVKK